MRTFFIYFEEKKGFHECSKKAAQRKPVRILPHGNLDSRSSRDVMDLLLKASRRYQQTVLMITHNRDLASSADRVFQVTDGVVCELGGEGR